MNNSQKNYLQMYKQLRLLAGQELSPNAYGNMKYKYLSPTEQRDVEKIINSLINDGFIDEKGKLTDKGESYLYEELPLRDQRTIFRLINSLAEKIKLMINKYYYGGKINMEETICVPAVLLNDVREILKEFVEYVDKLENRYSHGFEDSYMDAIDILITQIDNEIKNFKHKL